MKERVPERKSSWWRDCHRHDGNNPEHFKLSYDDCDECAGDNGGEDKTKFAAK